MEKIIINNVRGFELKFVGFTHPLELCAQMNYETEVMDFIDTIKKGDVFFDLGACEGRFTVYAAAKGLKCYAFEPEIRNYEAMC